MIGDDDLDTLFNNGDFDEEAVFVVTPPSGTLAVRGWFTDGSDQTLMFGQVQIEAAKPSFMCKTSDLVTVRNGMTVTIRSTQYSVARIEKTGIGASVVYLKT
jgi:hypothetical protein